MSLFNSPNANANSKLSNVQVTQAIQGSVIPLVFGRNRVAGFLLWYGDFRATAQKQQGGGKGIGSPTTTTWDYTAAMQILICQGPIGSVPQIWNTNGQIGQSNNVENYTVPPGGGSYTISQGAYSPTDQGVTVEGSFSFTANDYGSPGPTSFSGTWGVPMQAVASSPATGQYTFNSATGTYTFSAANAGAVVTVYYSYSLQWLTTSEIYNVPPSSPWQIGVQNAATFHGNISVVFYPSGTLLTKVGGSPTATGQYQVVGSGVYNFFSGDANKAIEITYQYEDNSALTLPSTALNLTLFNGAQGQAAWSWLIAPFPGNVLGYTQLAYMASSEFQLGTTGEMPNYNYEVVGFFPFGGSIQDAHPCDVITGLLIESAYGAGFPEANLDNWKNGSTSVYNFWAANNFFISPILNYQQTAASIIQEFIEAGQAGMYFSEGLLKLKPYGDTSAAANGYVFNPPTTPIVDLDDDDFISDGGSDEDPVTFSRADPMDIWNAVKVQYSPRINSYNSDVVEEKDDSLISIYGLRAEASQDYSFICTVQAAQFAANLRLRRQCYIRTTYQFSLGWNYSYLEPMDLVTIPQGVLDGTGSTVKVPVRITEIQDDETGELKITAEEFPWGNASATLYPKQSGSGFNPAAGNADPGNTVAVVIEAPNRLALQKGNILYILCTGSTPDWGGCDIYVSTDGTDYTFYERCNTPARTGVLQTALPSASGTATGFTASPNPATGLASHTATFSTTLTWSAAGYTTVDIYLGGGPGVGTLVFSNQSPSSSGSVTATTGNQYYLCDHVSGFVIAILGVIGTTATPTGAGSISATPNPIPVDGATSLGLCEVAWSGGTSNTQIWVGYPTSAEGGTLWGAGLSGTSFSFTGQWVQNGQPYYLVDGTTGTVYAVTTLYLSFPYVGQEVTVQMATQSMTLSSVNAASAAQDQTLSAIISSGGVELFDYQAATLIGPGLYQLQSLLRGVMGSSVVAHVVGDQFVRLDQAAVEYQFDPNYHGATIYLKFVSFNTLGQMQQSLANVSPLTVALLGAGQGPIALETGIFQAGLGAVPNSYAGTLTYTSATTSISWTWNLTVYRTDSNLTVNTYAGQQGVNGLTANTSYNFYPFLDDSQSPSVVTMVTDGGVGSPAWAHSGTNVLWTQEQASANHLALSSGPVAAATTTSGTGGGSGGGTGGACPREDMRVRERTYGVIPCGELFVGAEIEADCGWVRVKRCDRKQRYLWIEIDTDCGETLVVTPMHRWPTMERELVASNALTVESILKQRDGAAFINGLRVLREEACAIALEVESLEHCYYIGSAEPCILTHNLQPDIS
jgi:hypothetical protein